MPPIMMQIKKQAGEGERMKKSAFAILATSLMVLVGFGALSASALTLTDNGDSDCVVLSGTVDAYYYTINPCERKDLKLENVAVKITEPTSGQEQTVFTSVTQKKLFRTIPGGQYTASVHKNYEYTVEIDIILTLDGVEYEFVDSQTINVGETDTTLDFSIKGEPYEEEEEQSKSVQSFSKLYNLIYRLSEICPALSAYL